MTALAASTDVEAVLGRTLTANESAKVDAALDKASALVRSETGRLFESGSHTVRRRIREGRVKLDDATAVTEVVSVDDDGNADTLADYAFRSPYIYGLGGYASQNRFSGYGCFAWVEVTYTSAGTVPDELVTVVASMAARNVTASAPEGAESYTVTRGPFSESASFSTSSDSVSATPTELAIIRRHALTRGGPVKSL